MKVIVETIRVTSECKRSDGLATERTFSEIAARVEGLEFEVADGEEAMAAVRSLARQNGDTSIRVQTAVAVIENE